MGQALHQCPVLPTHNPLLVLQVAKGYPNAREALLLTSNFVLGELAKVDIKAGGKAPFAFNQTGFVSALKQEVVLAAACQFGRGLLPAQQVMLWS